MMNPNDTLIRAEGLSLRYGKKLALDNLSFSIPKGRVVGLLGHNGAGKTSLMKALVGLAPRRAAGGAGHGPRHQRVQLLESAC
jgi:ABC-2 type transport system ATP-binding protein